jgi:hypothetical protein
MVANAGADTGKWLVFEAQSLDARSAPQSLYAT